VAGNGREALAALAEQPFDLVLMDVYMPEMDGLKAVAALRQREQDTGGHVPVLAMTACAVKGDRERCLEAGMDGYVPKPIRVEELFRAIDAVLPAEAGGAEEAPDWGTALARLGGDETLLRELTELFLTEGPERLADTSRAIDRGDPAGLRLAAHTLKGALLVIGAARTSELAWELERMGREKNLVGAEGAYTALANAMERLRPALAEFARSGLRPAATD
jgi:CheY-like chemotaxis protein/HPt (histidine-containing phosphotransfer) domain-containing protein